jgi:hypothetical protein
LEGPWFISPTPAWKVRIALAKGSGSASWMLKPGLTALSCHPTSSLPAFLQLWVGMSLAAPVLPEEDPW